MARTPDLEELVLEWPKHKHALEGLHPSPSRGQQALVCLSRASLHKDCYTSLALLAAKSQVLPNEDVVETLATLPRLACYRASVPSSAVYIIESCNDPSVATRLYAVQTLTQWCRGSAPSHGHWDEILTQVILPNWETRFVIISKALVPLFTAYVELNPVVDIPALYARVLAMPKSSRGLWLMLTVLLNVRPTLQLPHGFIQQAMGLCGDVYIAGSISKCVMTWAKHCPTGQWMTPLARVLGEATDSTLLRALQSNFITKLVSTRSEAETLLGQVVHNPVGLLAALSSLKAMNLYDVFDAKDKALQEALSPMLLDADSSVRLDALEILCLNSKTTKLPSVEELELLLETLPHILYCDTSSTQVRTARILSRLLQRIHDGLRKLRDPVDPWMQFVDKVQGLCLTQLYPDAPVERVLVPLRVLSTIQRLWSTLPGQARDVIGETMLTSWDKVRSLCGDLLLSIGLDSSESVTQALATGTVLVQQVRTWEAEAGVYWLRSAFVHCPAAVVDVLCEGARSGQHGCMSGLVVFGTPSMVESVMPALLGIWGEFVATQSRDAALVDCRGHLMTEDLGATVGEWLRIKEAASLMVHWATQCGGDPELVATHLINVLLLCKHKGLIQRVYEAFERLCKAVMDTPEYRHLVGEWLHRILGAQGVSRTDGWIRRSAGLPVCVLAMLHAEPVKSHRGLLRSAMATLTGLSRGTQHPWQVKVHALNVLGVLMADRVLAMAVVEHVARVLEIAVEGFGHPHWAVRNSSLMTFSSVVQLTLRVSQDKLTVTDLFALYPGVEPLVLGALHRMRESTAMTRRLFPVLMLISRLRRPSTPHAGLTTALLQLSEEGMPCTTEWLVRTMASRALSSVTPDPEALALRLCSNLPRSSNALHFRLCQVLELVRDSVVSPATNQACVKSLTRVHGSAVTMNAALEVLYELKEGAAVHYAVQALDKRVGGVGVRALLRTAAKVCVWGVSMGYVCREVLTPLLADPLLYTTTLEYLVTLHMYDMASLVVSHTPQDIHWVAYMSKCEYLPLEDLTEVQGMADQGSEEAMVVLARQLCGSGRHPQWLAWALAHAEEEITGICKAMDLLGVSMEHSLDYWEVVLCGLIHSGARHHACRVVCRGSRPQVPSVCIARVLDRVTSHFTEQESRVWAARLLLKYTPCAPSVPDPAEVYAVDRVQDSEPMVLYSALAEMSK